MILHFIATGRLIDPEYVRHVGERSKNTYIKLREEKNADGYAEIDGTAAKGQAPSIIDGGNALDDIYGPGSDRGQAPAAGTRETAQGETTPEKIDAGDGEAIDQLPLGLETDETGRVSARTGGRDELLADAATSENDRLFATTAIEPKLLAVLTAGIVIVSRL